MCMQLFISDLVQNGLILKRISSEKEFLREKHGETSVSSFVECFRLFAVLINTRVSVCEEQNHYIHAHCWRNLRIVEPRAHRDEHTQYTLEQQQLIDLIHWNSNSLTWFTPTAAETHPSQHPTHTNRLKIQCYDFISTTSPLHPSLIPTTLDIPTQDIRQDFKRKKGHTKLWRFFLHHHCLFLSPFKTTQFKEIAKCMFTM